MNKETYESLKNLINTINNKEVLKHFNLNTLKQVESWIEEVAKEYEEEN